MSGDAVPTRCPHTSADCLARDAEHDPQPRGPRSTHGCYHHRSEVVIILAITGRSKVCLHEAAHAMVAVVMGLDVNYARVIDSHDGGTDIRQSASRYAAELTVVAIAGKVIEDMLGRGRELRWTSDWDAATQLAAEAIGGQRASQATREALKFASTLADNVLRRAKPAVCSLAKQIRKTGRVTGEDCEACVPLIPAGDLAILRADVEEYRRACASLAGLPEAAADARG